MFSCAESRHFGLWTKPPPWSLARAWPGLFDCRTTFATSVDMLLQRRNKQKGRCAYLRLRNMVTMLRLGGFWENSYGGLGIIFIAVIYCIYHFFSICIFIYLFIYFIPLLSHWLIPWFSTWLNVGIRESKHVSNRCTFTHIHPSEATVRSNNPPRCIWALLYRIFSVTSPQKMA